MEAIRRRYDAATPGPWKAFNCRYAGRGDAWAVDSIQADDDLAVCSLEDCREAQQKPNARFIAAARTDIPVLLAEIARLRAAPPPDEALALTADDWGLLMRTIDTDPRGISLYLWRKVHAIWSRAVEAEKARRG